MPAPVLPLKGLLPTFGIAMPYLFDQISDSEHQIGGGIERPLLAVDREPEGEVVWIGDLIGGSQPRTHQAIGVEALAEAGKLRALLGHVEANAITRHMVERAGGGNFGAARANDDGDLGFVEGHPFGPAQHHPVAHSRQREQIGRMP